VRLLAILAAVLLVGCESTRGPGASGRDATNQAWYGKTVDQLAGMNREADRLFQSGKSDEAAALIEKGQPLVKRLLDVSHPTLAATEAASDLDDLYGRMLLSNRHYGWARLLFQKNLARWKYYQPSTPETARRLKLAVDEIEECDRHILQ
jgi:hypothetical protein